MDGLVKVLLYRGEAAPEGFEVKRDEFERALDVLFNADEEADMNICLNGQEMKGVTDIVLAESQGTASNDTEQVNETDLNLAA